jgi:arsenate reductase (glutaredoxin)
MKVYGIKNCSTVKKALDWLSKNNIEYEFHDYKKLGISPAKLQQWSDRIGWELLLNKKGTTWKMLEPEAQKSITDRNSAFKLMIEKTSVIRRPIIESGDGVLLGFDETKYAETLL